MAGGQGFGVTRLLIEAEEFGAQRVLAHGGTRMRLLWHPIGQAQRHSLHSILELQTNWFLAFRRAELMDSKWPDRSYVASLRVRIGFLNDARGSKSREHTARGA